MKLFFYYSFCSLKNQIKKIFKSWVLAFLVICMVLGFLLGAVGSMISNMAPESPDGIPEEELPPEPAPEGGTLPDGTVPEEPDPEVILSTLELIVTGVVFAVLFFSIISADKDGSAIFLMADVNLLFASPLKPQSVLLFRVMSRILLSLFLSLYFFIEFPAMAARVNMSLPVALTVILIWILTLVYGKLLNILIYTVTSTHLKYKKFIRPLSYGLLIVVAGSFFALKLIHPELSFLQTADLCFNGQALRWIPVFGWLKGLLMWALEGSWLLYGVTLLLLVAGAILLPVGIWHIHADFYEAAMAKTQEMTERLTAAQTGATAKRKKDRNSKLARDGLNYGSGASMFFFKTLYNRFRFAKLKIFTKTSITYLLISLGLSALMILFLKERSFAVLGTVLCGAAFFRSMGNPLAAEVDKIYFTTVPENPYSKVIFSLLGGSMDCLLDLIPAMLLGVVLLHGSVPELLAYLLLALGVDFYASNVMLFMELSLPTSLSLQIKQMIAILFIYFGLIPIAPIVAVGFVLQSVLPFICIAAAVSFCIGGIFYAFSPMFLIRGRK